MINVEQLRPPGQRFEQLCEGEIFECAGKIYRRIPEAKLPPFGDGYDQDITVNVMWMDTGELFFFLDYVQVVPVRVKLVEY